LVATPVAIISEQSLSYNPFHHVAAMWADDLKVISVKLTHTAENCVVCVIIHVSITHIILGKAQYDGEFEGVLGIRCKKG
jgi:hypothetical protein